MANSNLPGRQKATSTRDRMIAGSVAMALLATVGTIDYFTGRETSVVLLYLVPIGLAAWWLGFGWTVGFGILSTVVTAATRAQSQGLAAIDWWNAGMRGGVFLAIALLLQGIRSGTAPKVIFRQLWKCSAICMLVAGLAAGIRSSMSRPIAAPVVASASVNEPMAAGEVSLTDLAASLDQCLRESQPILLGSRDPSGPSCVTVMKTGSIQDSLPPNPVDIDGGPGSTMGGLYFIDRRIIHSATEDFAWHQTRLRRFLENRLEENARAALAAQEFSRKTHEFAQTVRGWTSMPLRAVGSGIRQESSWPAFCISSLSRSIDARDLPAVKRWSSELAAAAFAIEDLHRWYEFLIDNQLTALDFQQKCESVFAGTEKAQQAYEPMRSISQLPAGVLGLNGIGNYYEIERQAERLLTVPGEWTPELIDGTYTDASVWLTPGVRATFVKAGQMLSTANRRAWDEAAHTPMERSYLVSMLFRANKAEVVDAMCAALKRFDEAHPNASVSELMGAIMYRGHSFAGLEWADRYQPQLVQQDLKGSAVDELLEAGQLTVAFNRQRNNYGLTFTLRDAIQRRRLDCIRATDMIGALFRNAGNTRFGFVVWSAEDCGHSVAAYLGEAEGKPHTLIVDGLESTARLEVWPQAYFNGHQWPPGFDGNPPPYSAELYARGLDSYVWAEGYIIRGPNAGMLEKTEIPYIAHRNKSGFERVFDGPYPR